MFYTHEFVKGDQVKVIGRFDTGHIGKVDLTYASMTTYGLYEKVWVKFDERRVNAYSPEHLLMISPNYILRPCPAIRL